MESFWPSEFLNSKPGNLEETSGVMAILREVLMVLTLTCLKDYPGSVMDAASDVKSEGERGKSSRLAPRTDASKRWPLCCRGFLVPDCRLSASSEPALWPQACCPVSYAFLSAQLIRTEL
jgi:hypothetical protein